MRSALPETRRQGEYFVYELGGPEEVRKLVRELFDQDVQMREVKAMGNPLDELFT